MAIIDIQKISNNRTLERGQVFIGATGTDPVTTPLSVFSDSTFTTAISTPVDLDFDGMPVDADGNRINLYSNFNYTIQLKDRFGANFYLDIPEINV